MLCDWHIFVTIIALFDTNLNCTVPQLNPSKAQIEERLSTPKKITDTSADATLEDRQWCLIVTMTKRLKLEVQPAHLMIPYETGQFTCIHHLVDVRLQASIYVRQ